MKILLVLILQTHGLKINDKAGNFKTPMDPNIATIGDLVKTPEKLLDTIIDRPTGYEMLEIDDTDMASLAKLHNEQQDHGRSGTSIWTVEKVRSIFKRRVEEQRAKTPTLETMFSLNNWFIGGGGGCLSVLGASGMREVEMTWTAGFGRQFGDSGVSGGAWETAFAGINDATPFKGYDGCLPFIKDLGSRKETVAHMLECIGCKGLSYAECNNVADERAIGKTFGNFGYCITTAKKNRFEDPKRFLKSFSKVCNTKNGCNLHNSQIALVDNLFEAVGGSTLHDFVNFGNLLVAQETMNHYGQRGLAAVMKNRRPKVFTFLPQHTQQDVDNAFHDRPTNAIEERQQKWKDALAFSSDAIATGITDIPWLIESGLCVIQDDPNRSAYQTRDIAAHIAKKIVRQILGPMGKIQPSVKPQLSLFQTALGATIERMALDRKPGSGQFSKKYTPGADGTSPLLTALRHLLPHEKIDGGRNDLSRVVSDGGSMDPIGYMSTLKFIDDQTLWDRSAMRITVLDLSYSPYTWGGNKDNVPTLHEIDLFQGTAGVLKKFMKCDTETTVESPNWFYETTEEDSIDGVLWLQQSVRIDALGAQGKLPLLSELSFAIYMDRHVRIRRNDYWGLKGGWLHYSSYISMQATYFDAWLLDTLPKDYSDSLVSFGFPRMTGRRGKATNLDMLSVPYADAYFLRVAGAIRIFFQTCMHLNPFDFATMSTPACHPGGEVWENPDALLNRILEARKAALLKKTPYIDVLRELVPSYNGGPLFGPNYTSYQTFDRI